jgi:transmembrane sensor
MFVRKMSSLNQEIDRLAAEWAAKADSGRLAPEEQARLESWLAADIRHLGAYGKAVAVLARLDRLRAVGATALQTEIPEKRFEWSRRRVVLTGSTVAGLAAAGIAGAVFWKPRSQAELAPPKNIVAAAPDVYATKIGETRLVALADGTVVTLNTGSKISVRFTPEMRKILLFRGEALFNVAKNKARPFVVVAGDTQVRAVGTAFTVRMLQKRPIQILVQEGVVEVTRRSAPNAAPVRAVADTQTVVPHGAPIAIRAVTYTQVARGLAWQYGQIDFDNETLADAAQEFARYSNTKITVDPAVAGRTITGLFASNDPVGFAHAAAVALNLHAEVGAEGVRIIR